MLLDKNGKNQKKKKKKEEEERFPAIPYTNKNVGATKKTNVH